MPFSPDTWPIGAALLQFPGTRADGTDITDGDVDDWRGTLREVALAGFSHVDLTDSWVRPGDLTGSQRGDLKALGADLGLSFSAISVTRKSIIDPDPARAEMNLGYALRTMDAAADMGIPVVCLGLHRPLTPAQQRALWFWLAEGATDPADDDVRAAAVKGFRRIGERAAELGVQISLEMYEDTYLGTADSAVHLVEEIGLPNVGLNPDIGNIVRLHRGIEDWDEMLRKMLPYANYWHVKNYFRDHDPATGAYFSAPAPLELGYIDYRRAIGMALEAGFSGPFCVEHYGGDGLSVSARNRDYVRQILTAKLGG
ncbi:sugar phosphate isomerase/epimerase family protein [Phytoactinopolyspora endophytica]|uniref:sugar phosphate isomerase/epimerase family protein n=1 Tax=Phytoactinopolyspora endophytica TaxID=1642495 RepID=UPI00101C9C7B|nr:sugar phosphate isomerase/epimerase family protein [Phytoactinopolyspora endophytica]